MRSRCSTAMEGPDDGQINHVTQPTKSFPKEEGENTPELVKRKMKVQREEKEVKSVVSGSAKRPQTTTESSRGQKKAAGLTDLSKEDLLRLLGVMEGEVQAREDIIHMLKSERPRPKALEAHYGSAAPIKPLQALQRDSLLTNTTMLGDNVYEMPMQELDRLEDKHRETYRRMLEQLLLAEKCHRRTVNELDSEKRKHTDFMNKSDDFTNLLEQERERLKRLLEQEKAYQARKDKDHSRRLEKVREELVKLKSFALMLVDERQLHIEQIDQQSQKVQDLSSKLQEREQRLAAVRGTAKEDGQKVLRLEAELECKAAKFTQEHEEMTAKLANQESQSRQLRLKLSGLAHRIEELEENNKALQKSEEDLLELRDKISKGECGNSSLMAELETLRKRVLEMEGKDEEITKTESQARELRKRLQDEETTSRELRLEVEKLQKRMVDLEKLERAFNTSKSECATLHINLEREKGLAKDLVGELDMVKNRVKELENSESRFEKAEMGLKDDLMKLKSFTVILVDERRNMTERIKQEEQKSDDLNKMFKTEQSKVMEVTEKLIEESKKLLRLKSEMEVKVTSLTKEKDELKSKLASEEEKCRDLSSKVGVMKKRMDGLEEAEKVLLKIRANKDSKRPPDEENKFKELTQEIERLKNRLKQLEVVEGDLMKTEDEYDLLEKKFRMEQDKANALSQLLEEMKSQTARNKAIEKGEAVSQEAELRMRCKMEEAKTRDLQADVQALKEKIHELMNKEDQLSQLQVDYSLLQQRFLEEEDKKKSLSQEVINLAKELEVTKRYSRALRPSMNGRRIVDVPVTSTAVQTDVVVSEPVEEDTPAVFIRKSVLEENHIMSNLRQWGLKKPVTVLERYPPATTELSMRKSWIPWMKKKDAVTITQTTPEKTPNPQDNGDSSPRPPELSMSQKPGQPLHIRVTPDHENSTATLEITGPRAEDFFSSATIIPTLGLQRPRITIVPKPTTVFSKSKPGEGVMGGPERCKSPVTITTISRAKSPDRSKGSSYSDSNRPLSPVSIITVSTTPVTEAFASASPEPHDMSTMGRAVFKVTPEKQALPMPVRKYNSNASIITTTEDNKIHIHLGPQFKRPSDVSSSSPTVTVRPLSVSTESKEAPPGTVLRSPRHPNNITTAPGKTTPNKLTSSITITPITLAPTRPTQSVPGADVQSTRAAATRIPMSKGMKTGKAVVTGVSTVTRLESRAECQSMKIELRRSTVCSSTSTGGGKC
ncbi:filamin-A-interacting protein 1 isoform X1 [Oncorhynchus tshawytscha]|uniref:Cortactin-binding protein-2 N-terminal domain-containing protein n=2 Tax=Oncorhynchus tshawytscha TaxID=74940 RepID=A0AAZ3NV26_ONCTS|nr:filamin-A-interacting protein 1 isoform X1 [Oncorhynchus tshawytscha]XP_024233553.1 filamin-A-interacting protein 1 isoform X1 [Oncorhynchus tshawytscha]